MFPSVYVIKYQPYNAISPDLCLEIKKLGVREIVSALRGQPGNTDFEAMSTETIISESHPKLEEISLHEKNLNLGNEILNAPNHILEDHSSVLHIFVIKAVNS
jgi:hypothetical protein